MKILFVLAQLGAAVTIREYAWSKMYSLLIMRQLLLFCYYFNCKYLFLNWKFETLFFCWSWDCS